MRNLNILFMGTADFAVPSLRTLHKSRHRVMAVVTGMDQPKGRGQKLAFTPVKTCALELALPVIQPENLKAADFAGQVESLKPDLIVVVAFRILPPAVFEIPALGSINLHASLLPKYRGAAPINWALIQGEQETGVTTFFLRQKVDTGEMLVQRSIPIETHDDAGSLHDKVAVLGASVLVETVDGIAEGTLQPVRQDDTKATPAPKLFRDNCGIDWSKDAGYIHNFVRGLSPYPGATSQLNASTYKILKTRCADTNVAESPGTIVALDASDGIGVVCGDGKQIWIDELQPPSKKRMTSQAFLRGYNLTKGDRFT